MNNKNISYVVIFSVVALQLGMVVGYMGVYGSWVFPFLLWLSLYYFFVRKYNYSVFNILNGVGFSKLVLSLFLSTVVTFFNYKGEVFYSVYFFIFSLTFFAYGYDVMEGFGKRRGG